MSQPPRRRGYGLGVGRAFGIEVRVTLSFLALGVLIYAFAHQFLGDYLPVRYHSQLDVLALVIGLGFLLSVALHELAHALVARALRLPVQQVVLTMVGGATNLGSEPATPGQQAMVAVAGPLVNIALAGVGAVVTVASTARTIPICLGSALLLANGLLAAYNLVPGLPLDGGQLVRAALWRITGDRMRALRGTALTGVALAAVFLVATVATLAQGLSVAIVLASLSAVLGMSGLQLLRGSSTTLRLAGLAAGDLARRAYVAPGELPLAEALRRAEEDGASAVLLGDPANPSAVVSDALVERIPPQRRPWVPASAAARPLSIATVLSAQLSGDALVAALQRGRATEYLVVDGPRVVGVLRTADIATAAGRRRNPTGSGTPRPAGRGVGTG